MSTLPLPLQISILLLISSSHQQEVNVTDLNHNPGLLPVQLGQAKLHDHYRTFNYHYNLTSIKTSLNSTATQLQLLQSFFPDNKAYKAELQSWHNLAQYALDDAYNKFDGIFDEDLPVPEGQPGTSILQEACDRFDRRVTLVTDNLAVIKDKVSRAISEVDEINIYIIMKRAFDKIDINLELINGILQDVESALIFSRLTVHSSIVKTSDLDLMVNALTREVRPEQLLFPVTRRYRDVLRVRTYATGDSLVHLSVSLPVVSADHYKYYHLHSFPVVQQDGSSLTVVPFRKFMVANDNKRLVYLDSQCKNLGKSQYYCHGHSIDRPQDHDCILQVLNGGVNNYTYCQQEPVNLTSLTVEQIGEETYIAFFPVPTVIYSQCDRSRYDNLTGSYLLTVPRKCTVSIGGRDIVDISTRGQVEVWSSVDRHLTRSTWMALDSSNEFYALSFWDILQLVLFLAIVLFFFYVFFVPQYVSVRFCYKAESSPIVEEDIYTYISN